MVKNNRFSIDRQMFKPFPPCDAPEIFNFLQKNRFSRLTVFSRWLPC